jgi:hypothetical protein
VVRSEIPVQRTGRAGSSRPEPAGLRQRGISRRTRPEWRNGAGSSTRALSRILSTIGSRCDGRSGGWSGENARGTLAGMPSRHRSVKGSDRRRDGIRVPIGERRRLCRRCKRRAGAGAGPESSEMDPESSEMDPESSEMDPELSAGTALGGRSMRGEWMGGDRCRRSSRMCGARAACESSRSLNLCSKASSGAPTKHASSATLIKAAAQRMPTHANM